MGSTRVRLEGSSTCETIVLREGLLRSAGQQQSIERTSSGTYPEFVRLYRSKNTERMTYCVLFLIVQL